MSRRCWKDTRRPLGAAHHVDAGGHHVRGLAAAGQLLGQRHLVEVEGRVQAALAHLQLVAQGVDALPGCKEGPQGGKKKRIRFKAGSVDTNAQRGQSFKLGQSCRSTF